MSLKFREKLYVEYLIGCSDPGLAALFAMMEAEKAEETFQDIGDRLLEKDDIIREIRNRSEGVSLSKEEIATRLSDVARGSMDFFLSPDTDGKLEFTLEKAEQAGKLHLIKSITRDKRGNILNITLLDATEALGALALMGGQLNDRLGLPPLEE